MRTGTSHILLITGVLAIALAFPACGSQNPAASTHTTTTQDAVTKSTTVPATKPTSVPKSQNIINGNMTIDAGKSYQQSFDVDSTVMHDVTVTGAFTSLGGNAIVVYIFNEAGLADWANGHINNPNYNSGAIPVAAINATLTTSGKYYIVFDNTFSKVSSNIGAKVDLNWVEPIPQST